MVKFARAEIEQMFRALVVMQLYVEIVTDLKTKNGILIGNIKILQS